MSLQSIKYANGQLDILDQLLLPVQSKYMNVKGVEDGWKAINKMQVNCPQPNYTIAPTVSKLKICILGSRCPSHCHRRLLIASRRDLQRNIYGQKILASGDRR